MRLVRIWRGEKKKKKEERTTAGLLLYQAAPLKAPPLEIRSWRTIGFSCLLLPLLHCLRSFSRLQHINSNGKRIKLCPISPVRLSLLLCSGRRVKDISFDYSGERAKRLFLFLFVVYISNITSSFSFFPRVRRSSLCDSFFIRVRFSMRDLDEIWWRTVFSRDIEVKE